MGALTQTSATPRLHHWPEQYSNYLTSATPRLRHWPEQYSNYLTSATPCLRHWPEQYSNYRLSPLGGSGDCFESFATQFNDIWWMVVCLHRNFALKAVEFANQTHWHAGAREVTFRTLVTRSK